MIDQQQKQNVQLPVLLSIIELVNPFLIRYLLNLYSS